MVIKQNRFGQSVPDVFIGSIRLSKGYDHLKERENARQSNIVSDRMTQNRYNNDFVARVSAGEGSQLISTVRLYIKEIVDSSNKTSWLNESGVNKRMKIRIAQSLSSGATKDITRAPIQLLPGGYYDDISKTAPHGAATSVICKDIDINNRPDNFRIENYLTTETKNHRVYDIPYEIIFSLPNDNPQHLTYFAVCYYDSDIESLTREKKKRIPLISSLGRPTIEQIIVSNKLVKNSKHYLLEKNKRPYFGPIHQTSDGQVNTGLSSGTGKNERLITTSVPNIKTIDYRVIDKFKKIDISFKENDKDAIKASKSLNLKTTYNKQNDDVFFTDLFLNRDRNGSTKFIFGVKIEKIFRNYSHYAKLFNNPDPAIVNSILDASKIRKLRILRRRINENQTGLDRLNGKKILPFFNPNGSPDEHVVVELFNRPMLTKTGVTDLKGVREDQYTKEPIGTIENINLSLKNAGDILFFQVVDKQIAKVTEGSYQYGIELEIEERTQNYLISNLLGFEQSIQLYDNTAMVAQKAGFNNFNKKYTQSFMSLTTVLSEDSKSGTPWSNLIKQFIRIVNLFMGHNPQLTAELQNNLARVLYSLASPISNNPKDMDFVKTMMLEYASKIRNKLTYESSITKRKNRTAALYTKKETEPRTAVFKLNKYFGSSFKGYSNNNISAEIVDASLDPNYGYEYFDADATSLAGFKTYDADEIIRRSKIETLRYFNSENPSLNLQVDGKIYSNRDFVASNKYQYFAPSFVSLGGNKKVNLIDEEDNIFNKNKNAVLLLDVLGYNMSQIDNNMTDYTQYSFSQKLDSFLAFRDVNRILHKNNERELESPNYALADNYFGKTTKIIIDRNISDDQEIINSINKQSDNRYSSRSNNIRQVPETNAAGNGIMLSLLGAHYLKTLEPIKDLEKWNLRNPDNIITFLDKVESKDTANSRTVTIDSGNKLRKRPANQISVEKQKIIKEMPMQLKALLHQGVSDISKNNYRKELLNSNFNPLQDASKFLMFWLMHGQLIELQACTGYPTNNNDISLKQPRWSPVTPDVWNTILNNNTTLCRLVRYRNPMLLGTYPESLDLPIYNEYFLIKGKSNVVSNDSRSPVKNIERIDRLINGSDKLYATGVQPEYIFNAQLGFARVGSANPTPCLLYTSPSPRDGLLSRMPSSA